MGAEPISFDPMEGRAEACEIFFDIETIPGPNRTRPQYPPDQDMPQQPRIEDIEAPKSYKDPAKIQAAIEERYAKAMASYIEQCQRLAARDDAARRSAEAAALEAWRSESLHPWRGRIVSLPYALGDGEPTHLTAGLNCEDEREVMAKFWEAIRGRSSQSLQYIGFNVIDFDLPWLLARAWKYRLHGLADALPHISRDRRIKDLRVIAWGPAYAARQRGSLDELCSYLGLAGKTICTCPFCEFPGLDGNAGCRHCNGTGSLHMHGGIVFDLWHGGYLDTIARYGMDDVRITRACYRYMHPDPRTIRY